MRKRHTTELRFDIQETVVVQRSTSVHLWCPACGSEVVAARPEAAALATSLSPREIYRRVESGAVHFQESADGRVLVCLNSLSA